MEIKSLSLINFRNHAKRDLEFSSGSNLIVGQNGAGKTNILEAIHVLSLGKSPRAIVEADLVNINGPFSRVIGSLQVNKADIPLEVIIQRKSDSNRVMKNYKVNNVLKSGAVFAGNSKSVMFAPEDIRLVAGSPSRRRDYLDAVLAQSVSGYSKNLHKYQRVLKQRNELLDLKKENPYLQNFNEQLEIWNENLLTLGGYLQEKRQEFFDYILENIDEISSQLYSNQSKLQLNYYKSFLNAERLEQNKPRELIMGTTQIGPHRDDYSFNLINSNQLDLKNFGSRGQQRTAVFCLKLLEIGFIEKTSNEKPILLIDDIFSELDENYRKAIENLISKQQTIITTADINSVPESIKNSSKIFNI